MAIDVVSVQYNGGLLPVIIMLTLCHYHRGTRLNAMKTESLATKMWSAVTLAHQFSSIYANNMLQLIFHIVIIISVIQAKSPVTEQGATRTCSGQMRWNWSSAKLSMSLFNGPERVTNFYCGRNKELAGYVG